MQDFTVHLRCRTGVRFVTHMMTWHMRIMTQMMTNILLKASNISIRITRIIRNRRRIPTTGHNQIHAMSLSTKQNPTKSKGMKRTRAAADVTLNAVSVVAAAVASKKNQSGNTSKGTSDDSLETNYAMADVRSNSVESDYESGSDDDQNENQNGSENKNKNKDKKRSNKKLKIDSACHTQRGQCVCSVAFQQLSEEKLAEWIWLSLWFDDHKSRSQVDDAARLNSLTSAHVVRCSDEKLTATGRPASIYPSFLTSNLKDWKQLLSPSRKDLKKMKEQASTQPNPKLSKKPDKSQNKRTAEKSSTVTEDEVKNDDESITNAKDEASQVTDNFGRPAVVVICPSAERCLEVLQALKSMKNIVYPKKAFGRHIKLAEAIESLKSDYRIIVGTAPRISQLIESGALKLDKVKLVALDCTPDAKHRSLLSMAGVTEPLRNCYRRFLHSRIVAKQMKFAIV